MNKFYDYIFEQKKIDKEREDMKKKKKEEQYIDYDEEKLIESTLCR